MELSFSNRKLEKQLTDPRELTRTFGQLARKVNQRIMDLSDSRNLAMMRMIPAARCHELSGDRKGELAVDVSGNFRLLFVPDHNPLPRKPDGGLDWEAVTRICIISIEDYH